MTLSSLWFNILQILLLYHSISTTVYAVTCSGSSGSLCSIDCSGTDGCKDQTVTCRSGDPCEIECNGIAACSGNTVIDGRPATDVTITCDKTDACKGNTKLYCGTGECVVYCASSTACEDGGVFTGNATSYSCSPSSHCPSTAPFTASPTVIDIIPPPTAHPTVSSITPSPTTSNLTTDIPTTSDPTTDIIVSTITGDTSGSSAASAASQQNVSNNSDPGPLNQYLALIITMAVLCVCILFVGFLVIRGRNKKNRTDSLKNLKEQQVSLLHGEDTQLRPKESGDINVEGTDDVSSNSGHLIGQMMHIAGSKTDHDEYASSTNNKSLFSVQHNITDHEEEKETEILYEKDDKSKYSMEIDHGVTMTNVTAGGLVEDQQYDDDNKEDQERESQMVMNNVLSDHSELNQMGDTLGWVDDVDDDMKQQ